ncbi:MAG: Rid family detoxifying hydrolase [Pseudomonadota bacterium]
MRQAINTTAAPTAIGSYSQAIKTGNTVYFSGQLGLDPATQNLVAGGVAAQITQVFENLQAVAVAAGGSLAEVMKITVYLVDLTHLALVNESMSKYFNQPFPARTSIEVSALPKGGAVEVEAIMVLNSPSQ